MYIYPDNLKSQAVLWLWQLRDIGVIGVGCLISVFALAQLGILLPIVATAREFLIIIRLRNEKESEVFPYLNRIEKTLRDQGFSVKRADQEDIKRLLAVYFEQNVTTERFEDFDGERWIILGD